MDRNAIIGFLLIGLILILFPFYQRKILGVKTPVTKERQETGSGVGPSQEIADTRKEAIVPGAQDQNEITAIPYSGKIDTLIVETNRFRGVLSTIGGGTILSWKLKAYEDFRNEAVELVPNGSRANFGFMIQQKMDDPIDLSESNFSLVRRDSTLENNRKTEQLWFEFLHPILGRIQRKISFQENDFNIQSQVLLLSEKIRPEDCKVIVNWTEGIMTTERNSREEATYHKAFALQGGELFNIKKGSSGWKEGTTEWAAVRSKYFLLAMMTKNQKGISVKLARNEKDHEFNDYKGLKARWPTYYISIMIQMQAQFSDEEPLSLFLGPMDYRILKAQGAHLEKMMDFGWTLIRPFSIASFYALEFIHKIIHNWGWSIIFFSILVKVILYPLTRKGTQSMREMQALQPKLNALREKYKNDPQKMNAETMKLYKQHGVNPMGGCLPILFQMPILIGLFQVFRSTIMLRKASFLGVIKDLSAPDHVIPIGGGIHLLPILMGATMIIQQKMTVQDPKQKMMGYMMPVVMLFIFYNFSAGLNLYYLIFNILSITQDYWTKKSKKQMEIASG